MSASAADDSSSEDTEALFATESGEETENMPPVYTTPVNPTLALVPHQIQRLVDNLQDNPRVLLGLNINEHFLVMPEGADIVGWPVERNDQEHNATPQRAGTRSFHDLWNNLLWEYEMLLRKIIPSPQSWREKERNALLL